MGRRPWSWPPGEGEGSRRRPAAQKSHRFVLVMESSRDQDGLKAFRMDSPADWSPGEEESEPGAEQEMQLGHRPP